MVSCSLTLVARAKEMVFLMAAAIVGVIAQDGKQDVTKVNGEKS